MSRTIDFDGGCPRCGSMAARELPDGIECVACGHVKTDPFIVAKQTLEGAHE